MRVSYESEDFGGRGLHGHAAGDLAFTSFDGAYRCLWYCIPLIPEAGNGQNGDVSLSTLSSSTTDVVGGAAQTCDRQCQRRPDPGDQRHRRPQVHPRHRDGLPARDRARHPRRGDRDGQCLPRRRRVKAARTMVQPGRGGEHRAADPVQLRSWVLPPQHLELVRPATASGAERDVIGQGGPT